MKAEHGNRSLNFQKTACEIKMLKQNLKNILRLAYICLFLFILGFITLLPSTSSPTLAQSPWTTYEDNDPLVLAGYSEGDWQTVSIAEAVGGNLTWTDVPGAELVLYFEGSAIEILHSRGPEGGDFHISLDDMTWPPFNGYAEQYLYGTSIQQFGISPGVHQLVMTNGDGAFWLEAIRVQGTLLDTAVDWGLLLEDDFADPALFHWEVGYGLLDPDPNQQTLHVTGTDLPLRLLTPTMSDTLRLQARLAIDEGAARFILQHTRESRYKVVFHASGVIELYRADSLLASATTAAFGTGQWHDIQITLVDLTRTLSVEVDGVDLLRVRDEEPILPGGLLLQGDETEGHAFWVDDLQVWMPVEELPVELLFPEMNPLTSFPTPLSEGQPASTLLSDPPLEGRIVYTVFSGGSLEPGIYKVNPDNTDNERLYAGGADPALSPDGSQVVFTLTRNGQNDLYVINIDGTGLTQLTTDAASNLSPVWSPDGTRIAYQWNGGSSYDVDIYVLGDDSSVPISTCLENAVDTDEDQIPEVTTCPRLHLDDSDPEATFNAYPTWSPDSTQIAYCSNRDTGPGVSGWFDIYTRSANGSGSINRVTDRNSTPHGSTYDGYCRADWSPDGDKLIVIYDQTSENNLQPYIDFYTPTGTAIYLTPYPLSSYSTFDTPTWSPDANYFARTWQSPASSSGITISQWVGDGYQGGSSIPAPLAHYPDWGAVAVEGIVVDTVAYEAPFLTNGNCTLGEAIHAANTNQPVDNCASGSAEEEDTILLAPEDGDVFETASLPPAYAARSGFLSAPFDAAAQPANTPPCDPVQDPASLWCVTSPGSTEEAVTIEGDFYEIHADNQNGKRLFHIYSNTTLTLKNVTLAGGRVDGNGGAALNEGTLIVEGTKLYRNRATGNGGAIYNAAGAVLTVTDDSQIFQNTALGKGGGIYDEAQSGTDDHKIEDSCIFNNAAPLGAAIVTDFLEMENNAYTLPGQATPEAKGRIQADSNLVMTLDGDSVAITSANPPCVSTVPSVLEDFMSNACYVRPLLFSLNAVLYAGEQGDGRTQVLKDMRSVIDPTGPAEGGLLGHYGPTINSPINRGDDLVNHPFHEDRERLTWNTKHVPVLYRVQYPPDTDDPDQIWYYVAFDELFTPPGTSIALSGVWIAVRMNDPVEAAQDRFYIEGVGVEGSAYPYISGVMPNDTDPCKGYIPTVNNPNDPEYNPEFPITFYYNRETSAKYGIAHGYENEDNSPGRHQVTDAISNTAIPYGNIIPFYDFIYNENEVDNEPPDPNSNVGHTGSAMFVSESIWIGGLPSTVSYRYDLSGVHFEEPPLTSCNAGSDYNGGGWRYCQQGSADDDGRNASIIWRNHHGIIGYYFDGFDALGVRIPVFVNKTSFVSRDSEIMPESEKGNLVYDTMGVQTTSFSSSDWFFDVEDLETYVILDSGQPIPQKIDDFGSWSEIQLGGVKFGDYVWINSARPDPQQQNDPPKADDHGFLVIGWGIIQSCEEAINGDMFTFSLIPSSNHRTLYPDVNVAPNNSVPYVVDFSGSPALRRQTSAPRPFYCSRYNEPDTATQDFFSDGHAWFFFRMPDNVSIPMNRLYGIP